VHLLNKVAVSINAHVHATVFSNSLESIGALPLRRLSSVQDIVLRYCAVQNKRKYERPT
jgi:hypothetical protein